MPNRKVRFISDEFYHIYNRGNSKQEIFLDQEDYKRFTQYIYVCNSTKHISFRDDIVDKHIDAFDFERDEILVSIGAWVLMPNHFHIYLTPSPMSQLGEGNRNNVGEFMRKVCTSYVKYFNTKYKRTGSLFEGDFKAVHIQNDPQAKYLFSYLHLNPIKLLEPKWKEVGIKDSKKAIDFLNKYKWSSYPDYRGDVRPENKILDRGPFPKYFDNDDIEKEIFDWIKYKDN